jgi:uncharacterized membrane protein
MNSKLKKLIVGLVISIGTLVAGYFGVEISAETIEPIVNIVADLVAQ